MTIKVNYPPLEEVTAPVVSTEQAAFYLNRKAQTLRLWAMRENGPIRPLRTFKGGPLTWPVAELKKLVGIQ